MRNPIIGVTERGDPSLDDSWERKLTQVDGAIIITKNINPRVRDMVLAHKNKCILHASITGWGGTTIEPKLPPWQESMSRLQDLIERGFPRDHVVVRVDPIIPTVRGIDLAHTIIDMANAIGFQRIRVSVLDGYSHVQERFQNASVEWPYGDHMQANHDEMRHVDDMIRKAKLDHPGLVIEACAEPRLKHARHCGCVSEYDLNILGLEFEEIDAAGYQRPTCMCYSGKRELLTNISQCPYGCLYCYWQDARR